MARFSSLMQLLLWTHEEGIDLKACHPTLWQSVRTIFCHPLKMASKLDESLKNMKLSVRGSIRQENNLLQVMVMCKTLVENYGLTDISVFVRMAIVKLP